MKNEKFEEAYRRLFPISCQVQPHLFALDDFGDYKDGRVFVAEKLWEDHEEVKIDTVSAASSDDAFFHAVHELPDMVLEDGDYLSPLFKYFWNAALQYAAAQKSERDDAVENILEFCDDNEPIFKLAANVLKIREIWVSK